MSCSRFIWLAAILLVYWINSMELQHRASIPVSNVSGLPGVKLYSFPRLLKWPCPARRYCLYSPAYSAFKYFFAKHFHLYASSFPRLYGRVFIFICHIIISMKNDKDYADTHGKPTFLLLFTGWLSLSFLSFFAGNILTAKFPLNCPCRHSNPACYGYYSKNHRLVRTFYPVITVISEKSANKSVFLMANYGSTVKYSICNRKISPQTTVLWEKMAFRSVITPKRLRFLHEKSVLWPYPTEKWHSKQTLFPDFSGNKMFLFQLAQCKIPIFLVPASFFSIHAARFTGKSVFHCMDAFRASCKVILIALDERTFQLSFSPFLTAARIADTF